MHRTIRMIEIFLPIVMWMTIVAKFLVPLLLHSLLYKYFIAVQLWKGFSFSRIGSGKVLISVENIHPCLCHRSEQKMDGFFTCKVAWKCNTYPKVLEEDYFVSFAWFSFSLSLDWQLLTLLLWKEYGNMMLDIL